MVHLTLLYGSASEISLGEAPADERPERIMQIREDREYEGNEA